MFFKKIWEFLDGNKTLFGMIVLLLLEKQWFLDLLNPMWLDILIYVGNLLAGGGLLHKGVKVVQARRAAAASE